MMFFNLSLFCRLRLLEFPAVALGDDVRDRLLTTITTNLPDANYSVRSD